ncbi:MAG TPA: hypothetical protein VI956_01680 [Nitrospirota bacterium]|nr:hypothetical protein [Nitrospirota bacterium]
MAQKGVGSQGQGGMDILSVGIIIVVLNIPFGYWRANEKKFSRGWFLSIHAPVPFIIAIRVLSGLGWQFITFPAFIGSFFFGQLLGGMLYDWRRGSEKSPVTACLVWDMVRSSRGIQSNRMS